MMENIFSSEGFAGFSTQIRLLSASALHNTAHVGTFSIKQVTGNIYSSKMITLGTQTI